MKSQCCFFLFAYFQQRDAQHWGCPNVPQKERLEMDLAFKRLECSGTAEAFLIAHLCLLITCKPLGFYDLQAIRLVLNSGKPT